MIRPEQSPSELPANATRTGTQQSNLLPARLSWRSPNGHPYIVTECGGMQQEAACPECGARIGGTDHRLTERNRPSERLRALVHNP